MVRLEVLTIKFLRVVYVLTQMPRNTSLGEVELGILPCRELSKHCPETGGIYATRLPLGQTS